MANLPFDGSAPRAISNKRSERMLAELSLLDEDGFVSLATLTRELDVSAATVRRDLAEDAFILFQLAPDGRLSSSGCGRPSAWRPGGGARPRRRG